MSEIYFNRVRPLGHEMEYVQEAVRSQFLGGDGPFTRRCEALLERELGSPRVLLTTSGTHALELAALLLGVGQGDEVVLPSFTFASSANAFALRGARPVFVDIREDTLNLDEARLAAALTERTRVIVPVHYAGVGCAMTEIAAVAQRAGAEMVEDNAHGLFGGYCGRPLGGFGAVAALSFHDTKNFTCGEGGALILNRPDLIERAEILREKGTDRSRFFRGQVDRYTWRAVGSSYVPSDLLAAFLLGQLEQRSLVQARRREIWSRYAAGLADWAKANGVRVPTVPEQCQSAYHLYHLIMPTAAHRDALIAHLRSRAIRAVFHYLPLHLSEVGRRFGGREGDCPVTESISGRLLRLPFYNSFSPADQDRVIAAVHEFAG